MPDLYVWPASAEHFNDLPTCDLESLEILSLLALTPLQDLSYWQGSEYTSLPLLNTGAEELSGSSLKQYLWQRCLKEWPAEAHIKADALAWTARVEQQVGNLVWHSLFGVPINWARVTRSAYCANLTFPGNLVASRALYLKSKARLSHAGLWGADLADLENIEEQLAKATDPQTKELLSVKQRQAKIKARYQEHQVFGMAQQVFGDLAAKLGPSEFFYEELSLLDVVSYSKLAFFVYSDLPQASLANYLRGNFPTLVQHTRRVHQRIFGRFQPVIARPVRSSVTLKSLLHGLLTIPDAFYRPRVGKKQESKQELAFARKRFFYYTLAGLTTGIFAYSQGLLPIPGGLFIRAPLNEDDEE